MRAGFKVVAAADGSRAIELYQHHRSEIAVSVVDLGLPKISGIEVIRTIKNLNPAAKIIVTTGYIQPEVKSEAFLAGISDFIEKPYDVTEIVEAILRQLITEAPQAPSMAH